MSIASLVFRDALEVQIVRMLLGAIFLQVYKVFLLGKKATRQFCTKLLWINTVSVYTVTSGHPGSRNDKTIIRFDELNAADGTPVLHKGAWFIVDGGYHQWRILQTPIKCVAKKRSILQLPLGVGAEKR